MRGNVHMGGAEVPRVYQSFHANPTQPTLVDVHRMSISGIRQKGLKINPGCVEQSGVKSSDSHRVVSCCL